MAETDAVIDLSHFNHNPDFKLAKADGILGVIHKATQGTSFLDPTYLIFEDTPAPPFEMLNLTGK